MVMLPARPLLVSGGLLVATLTHAVAIDMAEVRRLAQQPARTILRDSPFGDVTDADYRLKVEGSPRPVVVVFYADLDENSRNLATLARYLALDFSAQITFLGYRATDGVQVEAPTLQRLEKLYGLKRVPATLFYDNDRGKIELERTHYAVPTLAEYRTPGMLLFRTYYTSIHEYITKHILD
jgi:hypothetical protein